MQTNPITIARRMLFRLLTGAATLFHASAGLQAQYSDALKYHIPPATAGVQNAARLGSAVAVDGAYAVAGAPYDDTGGADSGVVKVFNSSTGALMHTLPHPNPAESKGYFGTAVALSGTFLVVGAYSDTVAGATNAGRVYIYNLAGGTPTVPIAVLENPAPFAGDHFGSAVSISGSRVVVGAPGNRVASTNCGSAYVYNLSGGTPTVPVQVLDNPDPNESASFGGEVGISGLRIIVGAPNGDTGASNSGSAYAYNLASPTPAVPVATLHNPSPATGDSFAASVGISGTRIVIGAPGDAAGASSAGVAHVYDLASGTPSVPVLTLSKSSPAASEQFGSAVRVLGQYVLVSALGESVGGFRDAGAAYLFDVTSATPNVPAGVFSNPTPAVDDFFGISIGMAGSSVIIGASSDDTGAPQAGIAYLYDLAGSTPTNPTITLNNPGAAPGGGFGHNVAVSGSIMAVSYQSFMPGGLRVQVFDLAGVAPATPVLSLSIGDEVAVSGTRVVVGAPSQLVGGSVYGAVHVFDLAGPTPSTPVFILSNPGTSGADVEFGCSLGISGNKVVVGSEGGEAYVYDLAGPTPTVPVVTLQSPTPGTAELFGSTVAISGDKVAVGDFYEDTGAMDAGAVYVFDLAVPAPTVPIATFLNPSPAPLDQFGRTLAISGTRVAVGCHLSDIGGADSGMVYVYDLAGATPAAPALVVPNPSPAPGDYFGFSLGISGSYLVVGSPSDNTEAADSGSAYLFDTSRAAPTVPVQTVSTPSLSRPLDSFGRAVAIDGLRVVVGAPGVDTVMAEKGYAYVFGPTTTLTQVPSLTAPLTGAIHPGLVSVGFNLPENALPGSVKLSFRKGASCNVFTLAASQETSGARNFTFDPANPTAAPEIAAAATLGDGTYTVALSYQDAIGSGAATSNAATNVIVDSTPPAISPPGGGFSPVLFPNPLPIPDYTAQAVTFDEVGVASVTQSPAPGTMIAQGNTLVTLTATDAAGRTASTAFNVLVVTYTQDTDGDGLNDGPEVQMAALGFNWQVAQPDLVNALHTGANGAGLYTTSQIQALNVDTPLIQRNPTTGIFKLTIGVQKSTDLQNFTPFPMTAPQTLINPQGKLEFHFTAPGNTEFFRVQSN